MPTISGTRGNDTLEGTSGNDKIHARQGNDVLYYKVADNGSAGTFDRYIGGKGLDMLVLKFTLDEWLDPANQAELTRYFDWRDKVKTNRAGEIPDGGRHEFTFEFGSAKLKIRMLEQLGVVVDDEWLGGDGALFPRPDPIANNDSVFITEDSSEVTIDALYSSLPGEGDDVPNLVKDLRIVGGQGPMHGIVTVLNQSPRPGDWKFQYALDGDYHYLRSGDILSDSFDYQVTDATGKTSTATVKISILGINDAATFTHLATNDFTVKEDQLANAAYGLITVRDVDIDENNLGPQDEITGTFGTFSIRADGQYVYRLDNSKITVQELAEDEVRQDQFLIKSKDGTELTVGFDVVGTNDTASITGADTYTLTEDVQVDADKQLSVTGKLLISDADLGQNRFSTIVNSAAGNIGALTVLADGSLIYKINNSDPKVQGLAKGQERRETFTISSIDGSASKQMTFVTQGADEPNAPIANADVLWVSNNTLVKLPTSILLANDTDADGAPALLRITGFSGGPTPNIVPTLSADKNYFIFDANGLSGDYGFNYVVADGDNLTREGRVTVKADSLSNLSGFIPRLLGENYSGAYLAAESLFNQIYAGHGISFIIGDAYTPNFLTGNDFSDVISVGKNLEIRREFNAKAGPDTFINPDPDVEIGVSNDTLTELAIERNTLRGGPSNGIGETTKDDEVSIGDSMIFAVSSDAIATAVMGHKVTAETAPLFGYLISDNKISGDVENASMAGFNGDDRLYLGSALDVTLAATAKSINASDTSTAAAAAPDLNIQINHNQIFGESKSYSGTARLGDDELKFVDSADITVSANSLVNITGGNLPPSAVNLAYTMPTMRLSIYDNQLYGDAERMYGAGTGGNDVLSFVDDLHINLNATAAGAGSSAVANFNLFIGGNILIGDAGEMIGGAGGNDVISMGRNIQWQRSGQTNLSINIGLNYLVGDARALKSGARGGDDTLTGADVEDGITSIIGDALSAEADTSGGNDRLISGSGQDYMWGDFWGVSRPAPAVHGAFGADVFVFSENNGSDVIYDFHLSEDKIEIKGLANIRRFSDLSSKIMISDTDDSNCVIALDASNSITLIGIQAAQLTADDFLFS